MIATSGSNNSEDHEETPSYQEVVFLKEVVGSTLIAALADLCIHRPTDPMYDNDAFLISKTNS